MPRYTVVIPALNSCGAKRWSLRWVIAQLIRQRYTDFDIVIAASESADETVSYAKKLSAQRDSISISVVAPGVRMHRAAARNRAAEQATGKYLLFMDDDCLYFGRDMFQRLDNAMLNDCFACGAQRRWLPLSWEPDVISDAIRADDWSAALNGSVIPRGIKRKTGRRDLHEFSFMGHFGVVSAERFSKVGGFDENYIGWGFEDTDLMLRLIAAGLPFVSLFDVLEVIHLTHKIDHEDLNNRTMNIALYYAAEKRAGLRLFVNRLFGVFDDGVGPCVEKLALWESEP